MNIDRLPGWAQKALAALLWPLFEFVAQIKKEDNARKVKGDDE